jgi:hypothetical protein
MDEGMSGATAIGAQGGKSVGPVDIAQTSETVADSGIAGCTLPAMACLDGRQRFISITQKEDHHG